MGYLYLMKRETNNTFLSKVSMQYEIKIGISKTPIRRERSVNRSTKGRVRMIMCVPFGNPRKYEQRLHRMFDCSRFTIKKGRGQKSNGHKEWFYLNPLELVIVKAWIRWWQIRWWLLLIGVLFFLMIIN